MDYMEYVEIANRLRSCGRYWAAQINDKKAWQLLKQIDYNSMDYDHKKQLYDRMITLVGNIKHLDVNFDFDKFKMFGGNIVESVLVPDTVDNFNYTPIFTKYCNDDVKEIVLYENEIYMQFHLQSVRRLIQIFQDNCPNWKLLMLKSRKANNNGAQSQQTMLEQFKKELERKDISFEFELTEQADFYQNKLILSNGHVFIFEKGVHYFTYSKPSDSGIPFVLKNNIEIWKTGFFNN